MLLNIIITKHRAHLYTFTDKTECNSLPHHHTLCINPLEHKHQRTTTHRQPPTFHPLSTSHHIHHIVILVSATSNMIMVLKDSNIYMSFFYVNINGYLRTYIYISWFIFIYVIKISYIIEYEDVAISDCVCVCAFYRIRHSQWLILRIDMFFFSLSIYIYINVI